MSSRSGADERARPATGRTPRWVAYDVLRAVHTSDAYANLLLPRAIARAGLSGADAALATELAYGTLRREGTYDAIIADAAGRPVSAVDPAVLDALRLGAHQLLAMRTPSHAAVNETVRQVRQAAGSSASGFANAVLRRISERSREEWLERLDAAARSDDERLSVRYAHPVWVIRAFRRALAAEGRADELESLLDADNASPTVTLAALPGLAERPADATPTPYSPIGFRSAGETPARSSRHPTVASACRTKAPSWRPSPSPAPFRLRRERCGSTSAPPRAGRPRCWPQRRSRTVPVSRPTSCRPHEPGSSETPSRACRSTSRCRRRTAASVRGAGGTTASSWTRRVRVSAP